MEKNFKEIEKLIFEEIENINIKLKGISYLELLKYNLSRKLSPLLKSSNFSEFKDFNKQLKIDKKDLDIEANLIINSKATSELSQNIKENTLYLMLFGGLTIDIHDNLDNKKFTKLNIFPLMGICLSPKTIVNFNFFNNSFFIKILKKELNNNIENI